MGVEIDDGYPAQAVSDTRPQRADGDVVEQTKSHRARGLGMMPRRAYRTEGIVGSTGHDRINRGDNCSGGAQGRLARGRRQDRVSIDPDMPRSRNGAQHALDMLARVNTDEIIEC